MRVWVILFFITQALLAFGGVIVDPSVSVSYAFPSSELTALHDIFTSLNGQNWIWRTNNESEIVGQIWNFSKPSPNPCADDWQGVLCSTNCSNSPCNVVVLDLEEMNLRGALPPSIDQLTELTELYLLRNWINGTMVPSLGNLSHLEVLNLIYNDLVGPVPQSLTNLHNLTTLLLSNNFLSGTIPVGFGSCSRLTILDVFQNALENPIPEDLLLLNNTLKTLDLASNYFSGHLPEWMAHMKSLEVLSLADCGCEGPLPSSWGNMSSLINLDLRINIISGSIPESFSQLSNLQFFLLRNNTLMGSLSESLMTGWKSMLEFNAFGNYMTGVIPENIHDMCNIEIFDVGGNHVHGTLPKSIGQLRNLSTLMLLSNHLDGFLPSELYNATNLQHLVLGRNYFEGKLNPLLTKLDRLRVLVLGENNFSGELPSFIGNISTLGMLTLDNNNFWGKIPMSYTTFPDLRLLYMHFNMLSGPIPTELMQMVNMKILYIFDNFLTGTIPVFLPNSSMLEVDVRLNLLDGSLSTEHFATPKLQIFYASFNLLTGSIPEIPAAQALEQLVLQFNLLDGPLPNSLGNLWRVNTVFAQRNYLTGTLPSSFKTMHWLLMLNLQENYLSGSIEHVLLNDSHLRWMNVSQNLLSGSLPQALRDIHRLRSFDVSSNHFTGSVDYLFLDKPLLRELFLQHNSFRGTFVNMINGSAQPRLTSLDISSNFLQGPIPGTFFAKNNRLFSFAAVKNCISGSLPPEICHSYSMRSLALDGLHTADTCKHEYFPDIPFIQTYQLEGELTGIIPLCLFNMTSLRTLHMSGNGISSSLPPDLVLSDALVDLSLSHNVLTGSVPMSIQQHKWSNLDLSFNKFNGFLSHSFSPLNNSATLYLQVNRFSGRTPPSLIEAHKLSILQGNMFSCDNTGASLPQHDPYVNSFQCGSDSFNTSLLLWFSSAVVVTLIGIITMVIIRQRTPERFVRIWNEVVTWWSVFSMDPSDIRSESLESFRSDIHSLDSKSTGVYAPSPSLRSRDRGFSIYETPLISPQRQVTTDSTTSHSQSAVQSIVATDNGVSREVDFAKHVNFIVKYGKVMHDLRVLCRIITFIVVFIFSPVYALLNMDYSTYTQQYVWSVAFAYTSGRIPAATMLVLLVLYVTIIYVMYPKSISSQLDHNSTTIADDRNTSIASNSSNVSAVGVASVSDITDKSESVISLTDPSAEPEKTWWQRAVRIESSESFKSFTHSSKSLFVPVAPVTTRDHEIKRKFFTRRVLAFAFNCIVVLFVNIAYVYATVINVNKSLVSILVFLLSFFKLAWSNVVLVEYIRKFCITPMRQAEKEVEKQAEQGRTMSPDELPTSAYLKSLHALSLTYLFRLSVFNNVIAPFMAAAIVNPYCFYYILFSPGDETVSYEILECISIKAGAIHNSCATYGYVSHTSSYSPPFTYSYQCSSALLQSFADVFMLRYIMVSIVIPLGLIVMKSLQEYYFSAFVRNQKRVWNLKLFLLLTHCLPMLLRPLSTQAVAENDSEQQHPVDDISQTNVDKEECSDGTSSSANMASIDNPIHQAGIEVNCAMMAHNEANDDTRDIESEIKEITRQSQYSTSRRSSRKLAKGLVLYEFSRKRITKFNHIFHKERLLVAIVGDAAVLMTFGTIFPPIAVVICMAIIMNSVVTQLMIGRFVSIANTAEQSYLRPIVKFINSECKDIGKLLAGVMPTMSILAASFWGFVLFDCLGDSVGLHGAIWIAVVVTFMPVWLFAVLLVLRSCRVLNREDLQSKLEFAINASFIFLHDTISSCWRRPHQQQDVEMKTVGDAEL